MVRSVARASECVEDPPVIEMQASLETAVLTPRGTSSLSPPGSAAVQVWLWFPPSRWEGGGSQPKLRQPGSRRGRHPPVQVLISGVLANT